LSFIHRAQLSDGAVAIGWP